MKIAILLISLLTPCAIPVQEAPQSRPIQSVARPYNPLVIPKLGIERVELTAHAGEREVPALVFLPKSLGDVHPEQLPVVLFSHGLGGNLTSCEYLGEHWAARGYAVVFMQHHGSDEDIWKDLPKWKIMGAMKRAASGKNLVLRTEDVGTTIDALIEWCSEAGHALEGRLDTGRIAMTGHSFGAVTTQMVSGQKSSLLGAKLGEPRLLASIAFSPSPPAIGKPVKSFADVFLPMMLMTGTNDESVIGGHDFESRTKVYPALPKTNDRYELVLDGAEHSAFTDVKLVGEKSEHNPNHHRVILALTTAFLDSYLRDDKAAAAWLVGDAPSQVMEKADKFQFAKAQ
jgi:dienelactone hydrolase